MATCADIYNARMNGSCGGQYVPPGGKPVNVDAVIEILVNASKSSHPGVRRAANALIEMMADAWNVRCGRHRGGIGSKKYPPDMNEHITIYVDGRSYHLHLTRKGHLRGVTGDDGVELVKPWLSPGTPI